MKRSPFSFDRVSVVREALHNNQVYKLTKRPRRATNVTNYVKSAFCKVGGKCASWKRYLLPTMHILFALRVNI